MSPTFKYPQAYELAYLPISFDSNDQVGTIVKTSKLVDMGLALSMVPACDEMNTGIASKCFLMLASRVL